MSYLKVLPISMVNARMVPPATANTTMGAGPKITSRSSAMGIAQTRSRMIHLSARENDAFSWGIPILVIVFVVFGPTATVL